MTKRIFLFIILVLITALPLSAQTGLRINAFFGGHFKDRQDATEVLLKGRKISAYGLTLFRSLSLSGSAAEVRTIEQAVRADVAEAIDKEANLRGGRLYYGLYRLRPLSDGQNRYVFFRNDALAGGSKITLIYMEGKASIEELRRNFAK